MLSPWPQVVFNKGHSLKREVHLVNSADINLAIIEPLTSKKVGREEGRAGQGLVMGLELTPAHAVAVRSSQQAHIV